MKRPFEETEQERLQTENAWLKDKLKLYMFERTFLHKRQESDESEKQLTMGQFKQSLTNLQNEKLLLERECLRLSNLEGG